jgi:hypothetical protein
MLLRRLSAAFGAALITVSCGGIVDPSKNDKETFHGTIPFGGLGEQHNFNVSKNGEYSILIESLTPPTGSLVGVRLGIIQAGTCNFFTASPGKIGTSALSGPIDKGDYCVQLYDPGTLAQSETYALTVSHP